MGMGPMIWTCLALSLHQAAVQEYFMPGRGFRIPIRLNAKRVNDIQALVLLVSKDKGKTWEQTDRKAPTEKDFIYRAPADGSYWFIVQDEDRAGRVTPANPERAKPDMAVIVDTAQPQVKVTAERLPSGAIRAHWSASDTYPDPSSLHLEYHTSALPDGQWTPLHAQALEGEREFDPGRDGKIGEIRVRVQMKDQAGNTGEDVCLLHGAPAPAVGAPVAPVEASPIGLIPPATRNDAPVQPNQLTSRQVQRPTIEAAPGSMMMPSPTPPPSSTPEMSTPTPGSSPAPFVGMPIASNTDRAAPQVSNLMQAPANAPGVQIVKAKEVRIDFMVGKVGPSGLGNADVYVTLDKGATWKRLPNDVPISLPPGADIHNAEVSGSVGVTLPAEGTIYGFIVAAKSKAGLAPPPPKPSDPPQALVELDITEPKGQLFRPQLDPSQPNTLLLAWEAKDRNMGDRPIKLQWAEQKEGPWNPIGDGPLPNTGQFPWRLPDRLPPRVYLRLTMRDLAGNESCAQTDKPELIDLSVPQTRITGVAPAGR